VVRVEVVGTAPRGDQPLRRLFRRVETRPGAAGVVVDERLVLTHASLARYADASFTVTTGGGARQAARLRHLDRARELAVLECDEPLEVPALALGSSATLPAGALVVALGDPFGTARDAQPTASLGVLEGRVALDAAEVSYAGEVLLTDAAVNPGSEGGPLLDLSGAVVGVLAPLAEDRRTGALHGHAIPAEAAQQVLQVARAAKPRLGFHARLGPDGVEVATVEPQGLAARAGLRPGDLIRHVGGRAVSSTDDLRQALAGAEGPVAVSVERDGKRVELRLQLGGAR
jgi:S1-C subfamily serine protease